MASCATCGHDNPDGAWSCASCGQPLSSGAGGGGVVNEPFEPVRDHDYYQAPTIYGTSAPIIPPLEAKGKSGGDGSDVLKIVAIVGILAILAIVAVWFFVLRPDGDGASVAPQKSASVVAALGESRQRSAGRETAALPVHRRSRDRSRGAAAQSLEVAGCSAPITRESPDSA